MANEQQIADAVKDFENRQSHPLSRQQMTVLVSLDTFLNAGLRRDLEDTTRANRQLKRAVASLPSDDQHHLRVLLEGVAAGLPQV